MWWLDYRRIYTSLGLNELTSSKWAVLMTHWGRQNTAFCRRYFQINFFVWKLYLCSNFTEVYSQRYNQQYVNNGPNDGLVPRRHQLSHYLNQWQPNPLSVGLNVLISMIGPLIYTGLMTVILQKTNNNNYWTVIQVTQYPKSILRKNTKCK